jgi:hypothetical protein
MLKTHKLFVVVSPDASESFSLIFVFILTVKMLHHCGMLSPQAQHKMPLHHEWLVLIVLLRSVIIFSRSIVDLIPGEHSDPVYHQWTERQKDSLIPPINNTQRW